MGGPATLLACDYGAIVDGINIVDRQVEWGRRYVEANGLEERVRIHLASAMDCPFPDNSFDYVFCLEAAHCFADKPRFVREAYRVLRDQGTFLFADIVGTTHIPLANWQPALRLNLATASDWRRMLLAAKFTVTEQTMIGNAVYPGCRWWTRQTAPERRAAIYDRTCRSGAGAVVRKVHRLRASLLEFLYFRSVLSLTSRAKLRDFVLFVARKS